MRKPTRTQQALMRQRDQEHEIEDIAAHLGKSILRSNSNSPASNGVLEQDTSSTPDCVSRNQRESQASTSLASMFSDQSEFDARVRSENRYGCSG